MAKQGIRAGRTVSLTGKQKLAFVLNLSEGFCGFCGKSKILLVVSVVLLNAARAETSANNGDCPSCYYFLDFPLAKNLKISKAKKFVKVCLHSS